MISFGSVITARAIEIRWHCPPENWCGTTTPGKLGIEPDGQQHLVDLLGPRLLVADLPDVEPLRDDVLDPPAGVERRDRILEDHLDLGAQAAQSLTRRGGQVLAVEGHLATGGWRQLEDGLPGGRLAAAGLADEPEGLTGLDVDADIGDGVHLQSTTTGGELDHEVLDA